MNISSLRSPVVQCKLAGAMRHAVAATFIDTPVNRETGSYDVCKKHFGATVYIKNRSGHNFIRCDYRKGEGFVFYGSGSDSVPITDIVIKSLREQ